MSQIFAALALAFGAVLIQPFHIDHGASLPTSAAWTCADPSWVGEPVIRDGKFFAELTGHCRVTGAKGDGFAALEAHLLDVATRDATKVDAGPVSELFDGLPGTYYDVTEPYGSGGDKVSMRHDLHIASDVRARLLHVVDSKEIKASGWAGYLKKVDTALELRALEPAGDCDVRFNTRMVVDKPWFVPGGLFKSKVEEIARDRYIDGRLSILKDIAPRI